MRNILLAATISLSACWETPIQNNIYEIKWSRECVAWVIWDILIVWCNWYQEIGLERKEFQNIDKECTSLPSTRMCAFDVTLSELKRVKEIKLLDSTLVQ